MTTPRRIRVRIRWQYAVIAVVAAGAALFGLLGGTHPQSVADSSKTKAKTAAKKKPGASDRIKASPPPVLFTDARTASLGKEVAAQQKKADTLFTQWRKQHGSTRDDRAFTTWLTAHTPAAPSAKDRSAELRQVQQLAKTRTAAGKKAATWLETYGKKDIWKFYLHDQRELLPKAEGDADKARLKTALKLSKTVTDQLAAHYKQSAPYVLDPSLRPEKHIKAGQKTPYSYPSRHAARSAAAVTFLTALDPHRATEYTWMRDEVAYSPIYMAGHVPSDITAGTLIGDLIGDYVLLTNGH